MSLDWDDVLTYSAVGMFVFGMLCLCAIFGALAFSIVASLV